MSENLKPCPFCGGEAVLLGDKEKHDNYRVACCNCGTRTVEEHISTIAISTWNRRANTMNELKPCPFCGSESVSIMHTHGDYAVNCDATRGGCGATSGYAPTREVAIKAWNRRSDDGKEILS